MKIKLSDHINMVYEASERETEFKKKYSPCFLYAEWVEKPELWDQRAFIKETSDFMMNLYGRVSTQDRHLIGMLTIEISQYLKCIEGIKKDGIVATFNNGKTTGANPYVSIKNDCITKIVMLMNQLGLSPKDRMKNGLKEATEESKSIAKLLEGPLAY